MPHDDRIPSRSLTDPQGFSPDPLTDLLRSGAQRLIEQAVEAELSVSAGGLSLRERTMAARGWCATVICRNAR